MLSLAVALVAACAITGCGGSSHGSSEELGLNQAEASVKKWAEENKPSNYEYVTIGKCSSAGSKTVDCIYVYHRQESGSDVYEDREAEDTLSPTGYSSITDKGRVSE